MVRSKLGLKVLGLCAVVLGMMAFASVAQAEPKSFWLVNGENISTSLKPSVVAETDVAGTLLTELGGKQIHIKCATITTAGHLQESSPSLGEVLGTITFHGCEFFELKTPGGTLAKVGACTPEDSGSSGLIKTNTITGLITLHNNTAQIEATGNPFATIHLGEECAFGENILVDGTFWLNDTASETNAVKHLVTEGPLSELTINNGAKEATIDGSAWAKLGGATHSGMTFSAQPG